MSYDKRTKGATRDRSYGKALSTQSQIMQDDASLMGTHMTYSDSKSDRQAQKNKPMAPPDESYGNVCGQKAKRFMGGKK